MKSATVYLYLTMVFLLTLTLLPGLEVTAGSDYFKAIVEYVIDGDSLRVSAEGNEIEVRLWGVDAPEYDQPGSRAAKKLLQQLVLGKEVQVHPQYHDKYNRLVAIIYLNGINVNEALLESGHCWVHRYYCQERICDQWKELEEEARKAGRGLWNHQNPVPPWKWKANR